MSAHCRCRVDVSQMLADAGKRVRATARWPKTTQSVRSIDPYHSYAVVRRRQFDAVLTSGGAVTSALPPAGCKPPLRCAGRTHTVVHSERARRTRCRLRSRRLVAVGAASCALVLAACGSSANKRPAPIGGAVLYGAGGLRACSRLGECRCAYRPHLLLVRAQIRSAGHDIRQRRHDDCGHGHRREHEL
jgi:hypothetical protein